MSDVKRLSDLLPADTIERLIELAGEGTYQKRHLMPVIEPHRAELLAKGVDADYLGYVLEAQFGRMLEPSVDTWTNKGFCPVCGINGTLPGKEYCQDCIGDTAYETRAVMHAFHTFPREKFPITMRIISRDGRELWSHRIEAPEGLAAVRVPGYAGTEHHPVSVQIEFGDGTVARAGDPN